METFFINQWKAADNCGSTLVIGDTNMDMLKWTEPEQLLENIYISTRNFFQVIKGTSRFWTGKQPSLLDQCWGNSPGKIFNVKNFIRGTADHNMITVSYRLSGSICSKMEMKGRDRRGFEEEEFRRNMRLVNWAPVFSCTNVDVANFKFENRFVEILEKLAPMRKTQARRRRTD